MYPTIVKRYICGLPLIGLVLGLVMCQGQRPGSRKLDNATEFANSLAQEWALRNVQSLRSGLRLDDDDVLAIVVADVGAGLAYEQRLALYHAVFLPVGEDQISLTQSRRQSVPLDIRFDATTSVKMAIANSAIATGTGPALQLASAQLESAALHQMAAGQKPITSPDVAVALVKCESLANGLMTPELAKALVAERSLYFGHITEELQRKANALEIKMSTTLSPETAVTLTKTIRSLKQAVTPELVASRERVEEIFRKTIAGLPDEVNSYGRARALAAKSATPELRGALERIRSTLEEALRQSERGE
jgi:hypothetical protein